MMKSREQGAGSALFFGMLLVLLLLGAMALQYVSAQSDAASDSKAGVLALNADASSAALLAADAVQGDAGAFEQLQSLQRMFPAARDVQALTSAVAGQNVNAGSVESAWGLVTSGVQEVLDGQEDVAESLNLAARVRQRVTILQDDLRSLAAALPPRDQALFAPLVQGFQEQSTRVLEELAPDAQNVNDRRFDQAQRYLEDVVSALGVGGDNQTGGIAAAARDRAQAELDATQNSLGGLTAELANAVTQAEKANAVRAAADQVASASRALYADTAGVRLAVDKPTEWWSISWLPLALPGAALLAGLGLMLVSGKEEPVPEPVVEDSGSELADQQQEAILRLLDEMGDLADGDLTVEATVTEDITGAIADAINYAIEALRDLVSTIDGAAEAVDSAARQTQASGNHLAKASDNQSNQVASATESISKMAQSIDQVSSNAERSSEVARHSVEIAHKGAEAVRRTIDGMHTIRETIQDTSKRIKRLGESSQEIGNIVELINDIAEQTNILALNASIQASMAGEAGRGFGVVADEVQRLAERSTNATKQIEVLVKTIHADTNEAVVSMERSTTDVVSGALLAENAGAALDEIEKVSNQIAHLVQNISGSARQQATAAADVTRNMGVLQEISAQTAENTSATSDSISKLAEMASQLRRSVAGFTLPKELVIEEEVAVEEAEDAILGNLAEDDNEFIDELLVSEKSSS